MLDSEEIRWVQTTANDLNNVLQVISEASEYLARGASETDHYAAILRNGIERATTVAHTMVNRVGGDPATPLTTPDPAAPLSEGAQSVSDPGPDAVIHNPEGPLELILIVDDEEFVTLLAQRVLTEEGYRVITALDGFKAIQLYRKLKDEIDLVILDFTMPIMDGSDVFHEMLQINPSVAVVLSSGFTEQHQLRGMLARGLRGFIPKPYGRQKLLAQVRSALDAFRPGKTGERRVL
ncbi:MAG: response regulator [Verrucomicrobiota bacterium]|nr:response regulator [Verrucomicrobiota bacterium]